MRDSAVRRLVLVALLIALGTLLSQLIIIPVGPTRVQPVQAAINVLGAVLYGPCYSVVAATAIAALRNAYGSGTLFAFPGSIFGALLAGLAWRWSRSLLLTGLGELIGTALLAPLASLPLTGSLAGSLALVVPFALSSGSGALAGALVLGALQRAHALPVWVVGRPAPTKPPRRRPAPAGDERMDASGRARRSRPERGSVDDDEQGTERGRGGEHDG